MANIMDLVTKYNLKYKKSGGDSLYYVCPFCDDKSGHLNINPNKGTGGFFRCNKCGKCGGIIQFQSLMTGRSEEDVIENFNGDDVYEVSKVEKQRIEKIRNSLAIGGSLAEPERLDSVYRMMLKLLKLNSEHRLNLENRGLSSSAIINKQYKSVPDDDMMTKIPTKIIKSGLKLDGVPGFYKKDGRWTINNLYKGYFIPFKNYNNQITSLQIRLDDSEKRKYIAFSSIGLDSGSKTKIEPHLVGKISRNCIYLTEGALKADIACFLSYKIYRRFNSFLAIPGVSNISMLEEVLQHLKSLGVTKVYDAFDMDKEGNETVSLNNNVKNCVNKVKSLVEKQGLEWCTVRWSHEKGIDDYLLSKIKDKI